MHIFNRIFEFISNKIMRKSTLIFILIITLILTVIGGSLFTVFESIHKEEPLTVKSFWDGWWWAIVTMTTVGYGDHFPYSIGGRIVAIPLMIIGIGILGLLIGVISETILSLRSRVMKGLGNITFNNHIIICGWNPSKVDTIIKEIRSGSILKDAPIVLVNDKLEENPYENKDNVHFVKGLQSHSETLKRANISGCTKALIIAESDNLKADDTTILTVLQIESLNKDVFTCAELMDIDKAELLKSANCDEIVAASDFGIKLLVQSIEDPGLSIVLGDMISNDYGVQIESGQIAEKFSGKKYSDMFNEMYNDNKLPIALRHKDKHLVNPDKSLNLEKGDIVYYIISLR